MGLTLLEVRNEAQDKQYLIEWIGSVLGEFPLQLTSTGNVNLAGAIRDGRVLFALISSLVRIVNGYSAIILPSPATSSSSSSNPSDEYWDKCIEVCTRAHIKSASIEDIKKSVDGPESVLVQTIIIQLYHICEDLRLGDEFWVFPNSDSESVVVESVLNTSNLPVVKRGKAGEGKVCAVCGCDLSHTKRPMKIDDGTFPIVVKLSCPWSRMICFNCYQKNRRRCVGEVTCDGYEEVMRADVKYTCECGMKFASPQKKASHCRFCPFHKKKDRPKPLVVPPPPPIPLPLPRKMLKMESIDDEEEEEL